MRNIYIMSNKLSTYCDQWNDLQTMLFANELCDDEFDQIVKNCDSYSEFECDTKDYICNKLDKCKSDCTIEISDEVLRQMALAALSAVDVDKLVEVVSKCFESELRVFKLEKRVNELYSKIYRLKHVKNERSTTKPYEGDLLAFNIQKKFKKDDIDVDSDVDLENKHDAWNIRLVYNDSSKETLSLVRVHDNKDDYIIKSDKDKLNVKFKDDDKDDKLALPKEVEDHIEKHIDDAEEKIKNDRENNDSDLDDVISYEIKKAFPDYDLEIIEGDVGKAKWNIEIIYPGGSKDHFSITKLGKLYVMKSKDGFINSFSLEDLRSFPKKLSDHISKHLNIKDNK